MTYHPWRSLGVKLALIALTLTSACELNPCIEDAPWVLIPSGSWSIHGLGELSSCARPEYNTSSFRLNSQAFRVSLAEAMRGELEGGFTGDLDGDMGRSGSSDTAEPHSSSIKRLSSSSPAWREGAFRYGEVNFTLQEESPIGDLVFTFSGALQWVDSEMTISGSFFVGGACEGRGLFITRIDNYPTPMRAYLKCEEPIESEVDQRWLGSDAELDAQMIDAQVMDAQVVDATPEPEPAPGLCAEDIEQSGLSLSTVLDRAPQLASCVSPGCLIGLESTSSCARCIRDRLDISAPCADCLYGLFECLAGSCATQCVSSGDDCVTCSERRCGAQQAQCF